MVLCWLLVKASWRILLMPVEPVFIHARTLESLRASFRAAEERMRARREELRERVTVVSGILETLDNGHYRPNLDLASVHADMLRGVKEMLQVGVHVVSEVKAALVAAYNEEEAHRKFWSDLKSTVCNECGRKIGFWAEMP